MDIEKIINGLEKCKRHECDDCTEKGASQAPWDCPAYDDFVDSALAMLKEQESQESDEKNKEYIEDKIAVECLNALQTINKYIDYEEDECGCSYWRDKKGYEFKTDIGYFFEGLDNFEEYLKNRIKQAVKRDE